MDGLADPRPRIRGRLVTPDGVLDDGLVVVAGERIVSVRPYVPSDGVDVEPVGGTVLPGLVDVHCHGGGGAGFPDGDAAAVAAAARHHRERGTTSLLASLVTAPEPDLLRAVRTCADLVEEGALAGVHLEGPFLSAARAGAQDRSALLAPDADLLERLLAAGRGHVRSVTFAPELPGAADLARVATENGVIPSIGHTDADAATTRTALDALPRSSVTHLFNGMPPLHHRRPGPVAAALAAAARGETVVELVADGVHLADETVAAVFDLVGPDRVALVSDAIAAAGMSDGRYRLGGLDVDVHRGVARLAAPEGSAGPPPLAGGTARLVDVLRRTVRSAGVDLVDAVTAASRTPARLLALEHEVGALRPGLRADLLVVDDDLRPVRVMSRGRWLAAD